MEYYSSVFTFDDWYLDKPVGTIAQQYDHLSRSLLVAGNLPDGYIWHMLVQCGDNFNIVLMEPIEDTASAVADLPEEDGEPEKKPKLIGAVSNAAGRRIGQILCSASWRQRRRSSSYQSHYHSYSEVDGRRSTVAGRFHLSLPRLSIV